MSGVVNDTTCLSNFRSDLWIPESGEVVIVKSELCVL